MQFHATCAASELERDIQQLVSDHVADSLAPARHIPRGARRLIDVGAGGGFPGIVLAAVCPDLDIVLLEPVHKKHAFLVAAARAAGLTRVQARPQRLQQYVMTSEFAPFDAAISRATWPVQEWLSAGEILVRPGGAVLGMAAAPSEPAPGAVPKWERHPYTIRGKARAILVNWVHGPGG